MHESIAHTKWHLHFMPSPMGFESACCWLLVKFKAAPEYLKFFNFFVGVRALGEMSYVFK